MGIETQSVTIGEASSFPVYRERGLTEGNRRHEQSLSGNHVIDEAADLSKGLSGRFRNRPIWAGHDSAGHEPPNSAGLVAFDGCHRQTRLMERIEVIDH
jgi:hypothetical protein